MAIRNQAAAPAAGTTDEEDVFAELSGLVDSVIDTDEETNEDDDVALEDEIAEGLDADADAAADLDDEDDQLVDEDEDEDEEGEEGAAAGEGEGEGEAKPARDDQGNLVPAAAKPAADATKPAADATNAAADATKPAEGATKPAAGEAAAPTWAPLSVNVDKQAVPIDEASISRANGHVYIAMPEKDFARFEARVSRGVVGERLWRDLDKGLRELKARQEAPAPTPDEVIEARETLKLLKPHIPDLLDERDIALLEANIDKAKGEAKTEYDKAEETRLAKAAETPWEETQTQLLAEQLTTIAGAFPEFKGITPEDLEAVYRDELLPVRNALIYREGDETFANQQYLYDRLKARAGNRVAPPTLSESASTQTPASAGHSASTATPPAGKTKADKAESFNRGVDAAPRTTSLKAGRNARPANANTRDTRTGDQRPRPEENRQHANEDKLRTATRNWIRSDSLDFDDGEAD